MKTALFIAGIGSFFLYFPMEARKTKAHQLKLRLDEKIPFVPIFVIPYVLFFPYIFGTYVWSFYGDTISFYRLSVALILVSISTTLIYLGYPSMIVRPLLRGGKKQDSLTKKIVGMIRNLDRPNNVFPSNHVAYSLVVTLYLSSVLPKISWMFWLMFILISSSTVFIKQHYLIDVPAAIVLSGLIWYMAIIFIG